MAGTSVISGSVSNFGSLASIRKQAYAIGDRVKAESAARRAEQEKTGLIRNPETGEMVELSSVPEWKRDVWEEWEQSASVTPQEALLAALATAPHSDEVEENKALAAKAAKMQDKMLSGQALTGEEKSFLRANFPQLADMADCMEQEAEQLKKSLEGSKSKEEKYQTYIDAKMRLVSASSKKDGSILFLSAALDKAYAQHMKGGATAKLDIWA